MPQAKASSFSQDNNFKFQSHHGATPGGNNDKQQPHQPLGQTFDLSSLEAELPPNTGPPGTVPVTNGSSSNANKNLSHVPCKFFKQGNCQAGDSCPFSHNIEGALAADRLPCKYFLRGNCKFGLKCALAHYLPDGTRVNAKNILASNGGGVGNGYSGQSYGTKQQKYNTGQGKSYNVNQSSAANSHSKTSPEYAYTRLDKTDDEFAPRYRYTSVSPPDAGHFVGTAAVSNTGYFSNYHANQQSQAQPSYSHQPVTRDTYRQQQPIQSQQQQQQQQQQQYTQPAQFSQSQAPISFNSLTEDSLARFARQSQPHPQQEQEHPTSSNQESSRWSPIEQYAKPVDYQYPPWGSQPRRAGSQHQPHSLGSNSFASTIVDGSTFNTLPSGQQQFGVRRSYSTGGQLLTSRTAISPPQLSTASGINIQSSTPSATTPTSRFSFSSGNSTAISQINDYNLPVKPNTLQYQYSYQNISLASPVFDDEEDEQLGSGFQYNTLPKQGISDAVFEEDFLPGSLADVILTPQELKRRDSRSQSGTLNNKPSLRALLEDVKCTELQQEEDLSAKPAVTSNDDVFLME
ncbi:hypothetical protein KGF57_004318 [Candida theae]|uniref:C3H1-type domain-containing protein n=1 Tax=Candida theae TaxID=1198502 RepID=A0AAD5FWX5_9ASCO|nr:uncharacterized protein KGF57_004318 [Candida theae]KAI5950449.1 hypothetical protein KGF57_004318 [Candida theae]